MSNTMNDKIFYHIYPLGFCGAPRFFQNDNVHTIKELINWIPHLKQMHINAIYLGPVFESYEHGYDTSDYRNIDARLGTNEDFKEVCDALHNADIKIVLDGVFNHVGRNFWAFLDVQKNLHQSHYASWFHNLHFNGSSPYGDPFQYDSWEGHYNLVKLNLHNEEVVQHLLECVGMWMDEFKIDGLRLDAADCIEPAFFKRLKQFCENKNKDFWLMGEIIHGNYAMWANSTMLDSVTNYECYKGLYSSLNDHNYFEIAHSIRRQFGNGGIYEKLHLYTFVDNHDVNRIASTLKEKEDIFNIYTLLYTMPSIPSIYYGSEWMLEGKKHNGSDADLRPQINLSLMDDTNPLFLHLCKLGEIYKNHSALQDGIYEEVLLRNEQYIFQRRNETETVYIAFNTAPNSADLEFNCPHALQDAFTGTIYPVQNGKIKIDLPSKKAMILTAVNPNMLTEEVIESKTEEPVVNVFAIPKEETNTLNNTSLNIRPGVYEHFKGKHYTVLYTAAHSETLETYVVYRQLYGDESVWVRPASMFLEEVEHNGKKTPRFKFLHD